MFEKWKARRAPSPMGPPEYLIAGLGNPGLKYEYTRHNAGFLCVDMLAQQLGVKIDRIKFKSVTAAAQVEGHSCLLMKPQTFMNNSGEAIRDAAHFYKIPPERIIILFDDISLPPGRLRIRRKGSDGGHNGIKSILYHLNSDQFPRVKLGVGAKPHPDYDLGDWVVSTFRKEELPLMKEAMEKACEAVCLIVQGQTDRAMNLYNS